LDSGFTTGSIAGEIIARVSMQIFDKLKMPPVRLAMPDVPEPTSFALTEEFYIRSADIAEKVLFTMGKNNAGTRESLPTPMPHDVPGEWFKGPF
jgi:pyruvate dehydrogenase E1 component beta subunit